MPNLIIAIPILNEENFISDCLKSVLNFKIPKELDPEIWIIDGLSSDRTRSIVQEYIESYDNIKLIDNPGKTQSFAMNIAIQESNSQWIMRLDGHSIYPINYLYDLFQTSIKTGAGNVGGIWDIQISGTKLSNYLVHSLITHPFGIGNSSFRSGLQSGEVDTVPYGFFNRKIFDRVGLFNESLVRAQDYEFNRRIIKCGYKVWLNKDVIIKYYPKGNIYQIIKKYFLLEAPYNAYMWYLAPYTFSIRHIITSFFVLGVFLGGILSFFSKIILIIYSFTLLIYFSLAFTSSIQLSIKHKNFFLILFMPFIFFIFHIMHGFGVLYGLIKLFLKLSPVQKI